MDKVVDKIAGFGIPGLVLLIVMGTTGFAGAAAITTALAVLGGPLGMLGGIAMLGLLVFISKAISDWGFERVLTNVVRRLEDEGKSKSEIIETINGYPLSKSLKLKIIDKIKTVI